VKTVVKPTLNIALILHMHQPRYNITGNTLHSSVAKEVFKQTMHPYTFPPEVLRDHEEATVTFNFTGSLIEQINELISTHFDAGFDGIWERYRFLKEVGRSEYTGCGYFHPIFPLLPEADRRKQIEKHLDIYRETLGGRPVGFWPPELGFSSDLIPLLDDMGFKWTIVDEPHLINANRDKAWYNLLYEPHYVEYNGHRIAVVARDRGISIAQQSGYDPGWLRNEIHRKLNTKGDGKDRLLVIATDGENGWFRHSGERAGFWGWFFDPLLHKLTQDPTFDGIQLTTVQEYLETHPPEDVVRVEAGTWHFDGANAGGFLKWTDGQPKTECWREIEETSTLVTHLEDEMKDQYVSCQTEVKEDLEAAWRWLLMAETSCNFYWGTDEWLEKSRICCANAKKQAKAIKVRIRRCN
jgi:alpha-amylase/alpha-mannosidase (GH57 family)